MDSKHANVWRSRGYIPHYDMPGLVHMVTFRLFDSLPKHILLELQQRVPSIQVNKRRDAIEALLDRGYGACWLKQTAIACLMQDSLLFFDTERYRLLAWVIMPNHVHVVLQQADGFSLDGVMHSIKSYTANLANKLLYRTGAFWQREYFDRYIRDDEHFRRAVEYIHNNPVAAGLANEPADWRYSSADQIETRCRLAAGAPGAPPSWRQERQHPAG